MWRTSDQVVLGAEGALLSQQQHQSLSHDLFQRHHQTQLPELQHSDPPRPQSSDQLNGLHHALPQALSEAFQCQAADLPNMQLAPDNVTLQAALGLGGENVLAQLKRNLGDQSGQSSPELSAILAASLGMLPVNSMHSASIGQGRVLMGIRVTSLHRAKSPPVRMLCRVLWKVLKIL